MMEVQPFTEADLFAIPALQPADWPDITPHIKYYLQSPFCNPVKVVSDEKIVGIGATISHGKTAWLAHIIVHPGHRNKGIGKFITKNLIDSLQSTHCKTILMIATALGEPVYKSLGFEFDTEYLMFKGEKLPENFPISENIIPYNETYKNAFFALDKEVSGEDRTWRLTENLQSAYMYISKNVLEGFYMPTLGEGLIIARTEEAGKSLMEMRLKTMENAVFPTENLAALDMMKKQNFSQIRTAKRMFLGEKISFLPLFLFNRVAGSIG
ncbi:MAG: N-acetyltransferase [Sphingobacteriales bacterium]|nr:MAG: N-acetyltransferase [Sphingobacteriales bacterium]